MRRFLFGVALALLAAGAVGLNAAWTERYSGRRSSDQRLLYVQSGKVLDRLALSFDAVLADVYWIRAIQHYGGERLAKGIKPRYDLLYPLLDLTTTLDPQFSIAYRFGAIFLSEEYPGGPGRPDQAIALLKKALEAQPNRWQYAYDIAFIYYFRLRDYVSAAEWFQRSADMPRAPEWLRPLAASMLAHGGQRNASRLLWRQMYDTAEQDWLRRVAERRLVQLDALDQIDHLEAQIREFERRSPPGPVTWARLIAERVIRGVPLDPAGMPYVLNPWWGTVHVAASSPLYPMPIEPPSSAEPLAR